MIVFLISLVILFRLLAIIWGGIHASMSIHKKYPPLCLNISFYCYSLLRSVFRAPINFFNTTPTGRIINRFAKDVQQMDEELPLNLHNLFDLLLVFIAGTFDR